MRLRWVADADRLRRCDCGMVAATELFRSDEQERFWRRFGVVEVESFPLDRSERRSLDSHP